MANEFVGGISYSVDVDTSQAVRGARDIDASVKRTQTSLKNLDAAISKSTNGVRRGLGSMSQGAAAAGVQVQQFVGQVQMGTNAMTALAQQGADLGIVLGAPLVGVVVSLAAVLAGTLWSAFGTASEGAEDLTEKLHEMRKASLLTEAQAKFLADQERDGIKSRNESIRTLEDEIKAQSDYVKELEEQNRISMSTLGIRTNSIEFMEEERRKLNELTTQVDTYKQENTAAAKTLAALNVATEQTGNEFEKQGETTQKTVDKIKTLVDAIEAQAESYGKSARAVALETAAKMGASSVQLQAIRDAFDLIETKKQEAEETKTVADAYNQYAKAMAAAGEAKREQDRAEGEQASGFASGIAGRGMSEVDRLNAEQQKLTELYQQGLISRQEFEAALTQSAADEAAARKRISDQEAATIAARNNMILASGAQLFDSMADLARNAEGESSSTYKALFAVAKAFSIAQASMNLALAVSNAMASLPFPANLAAMGQVAASGASLVSSISSASFSGRELGGPVSAGTTYEVGERNKPELLMIPGNNGQVFSNSDSKKLMDGMGGGGSNITINNMATGVQVQSQGYDPITRSEVLNIISAEANNPGSSMTRGIRSNNRLQPQQKAARRNR